MDIYPMYVYLERFIRNNTHPSKEMISVGVLQGHEGNIFFFLVRAKLETYAFIANAQVLF